MKTATQIYDQVKRSCDTVPFQEIEFSGKATIKLYWTKRQGSMGYQVHCIIHDFQGEEVKMGSFKTNGCGFCKESAAYWKALRTLGIMSKEDRSAFNGAGVSYDYHVGGNFYRVPASQTIKFKY